MQKPPIFLTFASYHFMIFFGMIFIGMAAVGTFLIVTKRIYTTRWYLKLLLITLPLPYLSNEFGWIAAEVGRQPWVVYKVLRTADAASKVVPAGNILFSLIMFVVVYSLIAYVGASIILKFIRKGPDTSAELEMKGEV